MKIYCNVCGRKKSRFWKWLEPSRSLKNLRLKTPLSQIPILGDIWL